MEIKIGFCERCGGKLRRHKSTKTWHPFHKKCLQNSFTSGGKKYMFQTGEMTEWWAEKVKEKEQEISQLRTKMCKLFAEGKKDEAGEILHRLNEINKYLMN